MKLVARFAGPESGHRLKEEEKLVSIMILVQAQCSSKFNILFILCPFLASKYCSHVSYLDTVPVLCWFPPPAASPAAGCPLGLRPAAVLSGESPPSATPRSAAEAGSAGAPQTFPAAHRLLLPAADGPGNADVEPPEDSPNLDSLREKGKRRYTEERVQFKEKAMNIIEYRCYQGLVNR